MKHVVVAGIEPATPTTKNPFFLGWIEPTTSHLLKGRSPFPAERKTSKRRRFYLLKKRHQGPKAERAKPL